MPIPDFLESYFRAFDTSIKRKEMEQQQAQYQQRLAWEQAKQAQDLQQQQVEQQALQAFRNATLDIQKQNQLWDKAKDTATSQENFATKGGVFRGFTPQVETTQLPQVQQTPQDMIMQGPSPAELQGNPLAQGPAAPVNLGPLQVPQAPAPQVQTVLSPDIQRQQFMQPDVAKPPVYEQTKGPLGEPPEPNQEAFQLTQFGKAQQQKTAEKEYNELEITDDIANAFSDLGLKKGDKIDARHFQLVTAALQHKEALIQAQLKATEDRASRELLAKQHNELLLALAKAKEANNDPSGWVDSVTENPNSVTQIPSSQRSVVAKTLRDKFDLPMPTKMSAAAETRANAAHTVLEYIEDIKRDFNDPVIRNNLGPVVGRLQDMNQKIGKGTVLNLPPGYDREGAIARLQELRTKLNYLLFGEGRTQVGGRVPQQLLAMVQQTTPNVHMEPAMFLGALTAVKKNAQQTMTGIEKEQWGGNKTRPNWDQVIGKTPTIIDQPPASWSDPKDKKSYIGMDETREYTHKDGTKGYVYRDGSDGKFYEVQ